MNEAKNHEAMIGKVLESYAKPFKTLSANFPKHDVEIQLEFQRPIYQQAPKLIKKRPIYRKTLKRPKVHERGHSGVDYLAERNANEQYLIPNRNNVEYLPFDNVAGHNTMDQFVNRGVIDNFGARKVFGRFGDSFRLRNGMDSFGNHNAMVNFDSRNDISNLAGQNTAMDNFSSRNGMGNNAGYSAMNNFGGNAVDSFAGQNAMNMIYPGVYPMNHGVSHVIGQGKGVPPVARQAESESTTTEASTEPTTTVTANAITKGPSLTLEDMRQLFDEYAEKIISSKSGNEQQKSDSDLVPQVYIQDNTGQLDDSMLLNLDKIANLIKKGVQVHKVDENNQESFLPKEGLNWMRIKVPA